LRTWEIAETVFSDYAGLHFGIKPGKEYHPWFVSNDQKFNSSNYTLKLENFNDGVKIIQEITGQFREKVFEDHIDTGFFIDNLQIYLHYLKLIKDCEVDK
jgi:hypothetical protein